MKRLLGGAIVISVLLVGVAGYFLGVLYGTTYWPAGYASYAGLPGSSRVSSAVDFYNMNPTGTQSSPQQIPTSFTPSGYFTFTVTVGSDTPGMGTGTCVGTLSASSVVAPFKNCVFANLYWSNAGNPQTVSTQILTPAGPSGAPCWSINSGSYIPSSSCTYVSVSCPRVYCYQLSFVVPASAATYLNSKGTTLQWWVGAWDPSSNVAITSTWAILS